MISNFGGITGYTVYKTDNSGIVNANPIEDKATISPQASIKQAYENNTLRDTYEPRSKQSQEDIQGERELRNIRRLLEEISNKLTYTQSPQKESGGSAQGQAQKQGQQARKADPRREITPAALQPMMRTDIPLYNQMYGMTNPADSVKNDGPYNVLQACKNLHSWARNEYSQTEGFDTTYSPQELRDRISILSEIQNHINSSGPAAPPVQKSNPISERNLSTYKAMKKDPDRITKRSYFEATA